MTEKRYFYSDPLAAAWMAKHFGMEFDVNDFDGVMFRKWSNWEQFFVGNFHHFQKGAAKWHIHPDSLHLLEPEVSDLLVGNWNAVFVENRSDRKTAQQLIRTAGYRITQRDGKAFIWPESEEV